MEWFKKYELDAVKVRDVLRRKGVTALYHANSVGTACTFLSQAALLSRSVVQSRGLFQTTQSSDRLDKRFRIWNDVFVDAVDIHDRKSGRNYYGPVLFVLGLDILRCAPVSSVIVTKKNPVNWKSGEKLCERFYDSIDQFEAGYGVGDFGPMFMLRGTGGVLPLPGSLLRIVVDDPGKPITLPTREVDVYEPAVVALKAAARAGGIRRLRLEKRMCCKYCGCLSEYLEHPFRTIDLYAPPRDA